MAGEEGLVGVEEGEFLGGEGGGVRDGGEVGDGVFGLLVVGGGGGRRRGRVGGGGGGGGDEEEVVHAVLCEFGEALAEEGAEEVLGAREVGLEDGELEVEGWVVGGGGGGWVGGRGCEVLD